MYISQVA